jgi:hypothetical protein
MRSFLTTLVLAPAVLGQVSATSPKIFKDSYAPSANLLPCARTKGFIQTWYHGQNLPLGMVATQIGWRYDAAANYAGGFTHTMEIVLDNSPTTNATLGRIFTANLSAAPVTFLPLTQVNWPAPPSGGLDPAMWIPGTVPFAFTGPHLIVQVDIQTEAAPRSLASLYTDSFLMSAAAPYVGAAGGPGCASSNLSVTQFLNGANVDVSFNLVGGPPNNQAIFLLGADNQAFGGVNVLPLDLTFLGMTNCRLSVDPVASLALPTDGSGNATLMGSLANIIGATQTLFAQCLHVGATPAGLVTSNVAGTAIGSAGLTNYVYNWDSFTPTAQFGPYTTSRGAVILLR